MPSGALALWRFPLAERIVGADQLVARLQRLESKTTGYAVMKRLALGATLLMKHNVKRRSGATGASIRPVSISATAAVIKIGGAGKFLEQGTGLFGPHHSRVVPRTKKALAFFAGPSSAFRLTGAVRSGKAGRRAYLVVVKSTKGMHPQPFIGKSIVEAARSDNLRGVVVALWNGPGGSQGGGTVI